MQERSFELHHGNKKIGVIGLGYVGLPLALLFTQNNHHVTGIDTDAYKIKQLQKGKSHIPDISDTDITSALTAGTLTVTTDYDVAASLDIIIICVPTPLSNDGKPDLRFIKQVSEALVPRLQKHQLIILESSTYPGTTRDVILPILEKSDLAIGEDVHLGYSPERIDPGNESMEVKDIPKVISGITDDCFRHVSRFYRSIFTQVVPASSVEVAELSKLLENSYRFINISFINEMAMLCDKLDINLWEAIASAGTKPYGFTPFFPGPGIGGHCIPVDPLYLYWVGQKHGYHHRFLSLAEHTNNQLPTYITRQVQSRLEQKKNIKASNILLCGIAYKKDSNDVRSSPAISIMKNFLQLGANVVYHDPYVPEVTIDQQTCHSVPLTTEQLEDADIVIFLTDHSTFPMQKIMDHATLIYDSRNQTQGLKGNADVIVLGGGKA
ncbi:nucleotide sugar dehydrogenase [Salicibibacter halophilus]|uniref:Nucleotide sugar dehydrogenase n=1 Tax=Salicibibacter halophilus TaxID=2502791 RepID=A0A514LMY5_9BACI|nr:nucleotide sugar dehydrogenase [Salicibibacter halophilus]QDI93208.1 nucleotide sugar dehydrogenase [Salicibibacter halophilus]